VFTGREEPTGSNNRLEKADALAFWAVDAWQVTDALNVNLALRYEDVESSRRQFADPERTVVEDRRSNDSDEWLPGASFTYDLNDTWQVLGGVHRGFSPLGGGATESEDPETSTNYEAGVRYRGAWFVEAVGFYSDFKNKTENCSNADPCSNGSTSGSFNTGEATIAGVEVQASRQFELGSFTVPIDLMYTYTDAEISKDNPEEGFVKGDDLAAIPQNTFSARLGLLSPVGWDNYIVAKYTDEQCVNVGCNNTGSKFDRTDDLFVFDYISRYGVTDTAVVYFKLENVLDEQVIISRQPDGARPNKVRTASVGLEWSF
jgi:Fe(3+) dicitrate transport protein